MECLRTIRFKRFALISGVISASVVVLTWYFPIREPSLPIGAKAQAGRGH